MIKSKKMMKKNLLNRQEINQYKNTDKNLNKKILIKNYFQI